MPYNIVASLLSLTIVIDELYDHFIGGERVVYDSLEEDDGEVQLQSV
jgi:hypothetical protein